MQSELKISDSFDLEAWENVVNYPILAAKHTPPGNQKFCPAPGAVLATHEWIPIPHFSCHINITHTHLFYIVIYISICLDGISLISLSNYKRSWIPGSGICRLYITLFLIFHNKWETCLSVKLRQIISGVTGLFELWFSHITFEGVIDVIILFSGFCMQLIFVYFW